MNKMQRWTALVALAAWSTMGVAQSAPDARGKVLVAQVNDGGAAPLQLTDVDIHDATLQNAGGTYTIQTTGGDPYLFTAALPPFDASTTATLKLCPLMRSDCPSASPLGKSEVATFAPSTTTLLMFATSSSLMKSPSATATLCTVI